MEGRARAAFFKLFLLLGVARHERAFYFLRRARGLYQTEGVRVCVWEMLIKTCWWVFLVEWKRSRDGQA